MAYIVTREKSFWFFLLKKSSILTVYKNRRRDYLKKEQVRDDRQPICNLSDFDFHFFQLCIKYWQAFFFRFIIYCQYLDLHRYIDSGTGVFLLILRIFLKTFLIENLLGLLLSFSTQSKEYSGPCKKSKIRSSRPQMLAKKVFHKIHRKTLVPESLFK